MCPKPRHLPSDGLGHFVISIPHDILQIAGCLEWSTSFFVTVGAFMWAKLPKNSGDELTAILHPCGHAILISLWENMSPMFTMEYFPESHSSSSIASIQGCGGDWNRTLLQHKQRWIFHLDATSPPGLNGSLSFRPFLEGFASGGSEWEPPNPT